LVVQPFSTVVHELEFKEYIGDYDEFNNTEDLQGIRSKFSNLRKLSKLTVNITEDDIRILVTYLEDFEVLELGIIESSGITEAGNIIFS